MYKTHPTWTAVGAWDFPVAGLSCAACSLPHLCVLLVVVDLTAAPSVANAILSYSSSFIAQGLQPREYLELFDVLFWSLWCFGCTVGLGSRVLPRQSVVAVLEQVTRFPHWELELSYHGSLCGRCYTPMIYSAKCRKYRRLKLYFYYSSVGGLKKKNRQAVLFFHGCGDGCSCFSQKKMVTFFILLIDRVGFWFLTPLLLLFSAAWNACGDSYRWRNRSTCRARSWTPTRCWSMWARDTTWRKTRRKPQSSWKERYEPALLPSYDIRGLVKSVSKLFRLLILNSIDVGYVKC